MNLQTFDTIAYLEDRGIAYSTEGKNVTQGWINVQCPWCGDPSQHLGISPSNLLNCWRCGKHGPVINLVMEIENCSYRDVLAIIEEFQTYTPRSFKEEVQDRIETDGKNILPPEMKELQPLHRNYLEGRGFDPDFLTEKYRLGACYLTGEYRYRIIVPVIMAEKVVNFTGMDVTGQAKMKYKNCKNDASLIPMKHVLYNIDTVRDTALVVEGVTDVWRIGDGTVAVMGMEYTQEQVRLLYTKGVKKVIVMFDEGPMERKKAGRLADALSVLLPVVEVIELNSGDPADLSDEEVRELREEIFEY